ncbi:UNVERIFIED_CONTAM: putative 3-beta-hydroxysteroid-Delta(8),Delta(7)-isomerase [Sesamum calycinum]|uniref:3-beta-hydroxysteroid-Delta(8),Delta(7)-isomerase n=1 Tax=Sesamum calycinum TaxID=2727403 RepID=A0AAW2S9P9_9LAMI
MATQGEDHPYVPRDLKLPDYVPVFLSQSTILSVYGIASLLVVSFMWILSGKEYSKGDSRYAGRDSGVVAVEGITAVLEGPACLLAVYAIATKKSYNYILQVAISLGQLYGTAVYFLTSLLDGDDFAASTYYYYAYYVFANGWWVLIPTIIIIRCWKKICAACQVVEQKKAKTR